jgi:hypothetical protein
MPVTDISDIIYNFDRSYTDLPVVNLPLRILNPNYAESSTLLQVTSAYTNEQDKLIFYPFFGDPSIFTDYVRAECNTDY